MAEVLLFGYKQGKGWRLASIHSTHREALEVVQHYPDQSTSFSIYWKSPAPPHVFHPISKQEVDVYQYVQSVAGKECLIHKQQQMLWCIKADGMPIMFTDELFYNE
jgi:hypothetical protein